MKRLLILSALIFSSTGFAQDTDVPEVTGPQTIDELINVVREGTSARRDILAAREQRFLEARDERAALLEQAIADREREEAVADRLRALYEQNEDDLVELEDNLQQQSGDLTEVFSVVNQVSGDALAVVQNSLVSAQFENRLPLLEKLSDNQTRPTAAELRELWLLLLDEMNLSGHIARFDVPVISADGEEQVQRVTRIGNFTALSEGEYLRFLPESGRLLALARQPIGVTGGSALAFENAEQELLPVSVDPSRGTILSLIVQTPGFTDRIEQGGLIGYVILALGAIGLLIGAERLIVVTLASRKTAQVSRGASNGGDHAIEKLQAIAKDPEYLADVEAMSAKMDEVVTEYAQQIRRGLSTLAIFAAVSPLLGLLGTVTGMIDTFQVITLFGAGDPRLMSGGISQALVTTQLGLAVAIPLLLIHSFVQSRANNLVTELDEVAADTFARGRAEDAHAH